MILWNKIKWIFPQSQVPYEASFFYISHKIKCGTLSMRIFAGGVTLVTFYKEKNDNIVKMTHVNFYQ